MKALVYTAYGKSDVLSLQEIQQPMPNDGEVLVKVHAASINDWDLALLNGDFVNRMINGLSKPKITVVGSDISGIVEAVGKNVRKFKPGDEVFGDLSNRWGGFAEYVCADESMLALKPETMSHVDAAAIPQAAMLAVQGLIDKGKIKAKQKILINGAGGGVGTFGLQLAKMYDAEVTGVDSQPKLAMLSALGFDHVIDYRQEDFTNLGVQYDLILDAKTNRPLAHYLRALKPGGKYVTVGGDITRLLKAFVLGPILSSVSGKKIIIVALKPNKDLQYMSELYNAGQVKPVIDGPYKLEMFREAFERFEKGLHKGKIVFTIANH